MAWRKPEIRDIAAKLNQRELDLYRQHPDFASAADPVADLLGMTAESVRGFCRTNRQITMCPTLGTIPESLMSFAMDAAAFDILKRISTKITDERTKAWEKALEFFEKVSTGAFIPESWQANEEEEDNTSDNRALPAFSVGRQKILNETI